MVNADRVKRKLPSLLCDGSTTVKNKKNWAERHRIEYGLNRLRKHNPDKYRSHFTRIINDLEAMKKAVLER